MKIVAVLGSPRPQGNSSTLAHRFLEAARERGAETQEFNVQQMAFQGCQACAACKTKSEACIVEDDATPVLAAIQAADVLVLASPVYFGDLSGRLKCFFDRTYSFFNPDFTSRVPPGKQAVLILTQGQPDAGQYADIFPRYERFLKWFGFARVHLLRATGVSAPGEVKKQTALMDQAAALARELVEQP
jgi:multimeric flavodoxin WrbA